MKNKMVKALSIMMSLCMLGSSGVQAAEFSSGMENITELSEQEEAAEVSEAADSSEVSEETPDVADDTETFSVRKNQRHSLIQKLRMSFPQREKQKRFREQKIRKVLTAHWLPDTKILL